MQPIPTTTKSVLITGCSAGGIGPALAFAFQKRGYHVFATARNTGKIPAELKNLPNVETITLDVTSAPSIAAAVEAATDRTGGRIDVIVNNGGGGYTTPLLDVDVAKAKALYEVNFFGVVAMTQAFAPALIKAKGAVVNISSISGLVYDGYACKLPLSVVLDVWIGSKCAVCPNPGINTMFNSTNSQNYR
jgi:1-acylglycerone phosphate reductase